MAQSLETVRFYLGGEIRGNLILPVRVRARAEIFALTRLRMGYAASVAGRPAATEGPGGDSSGGATFRPGRSAKLPSLPKHRIPQASTLDVAGRVRVGSNRVEAKAEFTRADTRLPLAGRQGDWWCRLNTMAVHIDR